MTYLLDSNVWIGLLRGKSSILADRFQVEAVSADICTCSVVMAELQYGCARSAKPEANLAALHALVEPFPCLPFDAASAEHFVSVRRKLELAGQVIGPYDLQIAAIAVTNRCILVTHNLAEFQRVAGLQVEDWEVA